MKIVVISGSSRGGANSLKVANWYVQILESRSVEVELLDLRHSQLPLVHEDIWDNIANLQEARRVREVLKSADGYVIVSPEWNGMAAPALKNLFIYVEKTMADKPALLTAVSATKYGGSFPIAELHMTSAKNTRVVYIPEYIVVREADDMFNEPEPASDNDAYIRKRARYALDVLTVYAESLRRVRESGVTDYKTYPNGM